MKSLKIAFDAKRLFLNKTGLGNYARSLVQYLQNYYPDHEYHLFTPHIATNEDTAYFLNPARFKIHTAPARVLAPWWRSRGLLKILEEEAIDVYHGLSGELPIGIEKLRLKKIVTIHDVIFKVRPKDYSFFDRKIYDYKTEFASKAADQIITVSQHSLLDLSKNYPDSLGKTDVVYPCLNPSFYDRAEIEVENDEKATAYILLMGSSNPRKNMENALKAFQMFSQKEEINLMVIGQGRGLHKMIQDLRPTLKNIPKVFQSVNQQHLLQLMQNAAMILYPSLYEGFGLPALEALSLKKKVICGTHTSLGEAMPYSAFQCDVTNPSAIYQKMSEIFQINFEELLNVADLQRHLNSFNPQKLSRQLIDLYAK